MRNHAQGMTLIELLIAISAVVLGAVWLLGAYHSSIYLTRVSQDGSMAVNDLRDIMERIKTTPFAQLDTVFPNGAVNGVVGAGPETYPGLIGGFTLQNERITVTHSPNVAADPRELIVQLTWVNGGRQYQRRLSTVRAGEAS